MRRRREISTAEFAGKNFSCLPAVEMGDCGVRTFGIYLKRSIVAPARAEIANKCCSPNGGSNYDSLKVDTDGGSNYDSLKVHSDGGSNYDSLKVDSTLRKIFQNLSGPSNRFREYLK